jgi:ElaB/YqjD/DUF883 family membrane-anchored ribosome-binding protein
VEITIDEPAREAATAVHNAATAACRQAAALPREARCEDTVENLTYMADGAACQMRGRFQVAAERRLGAAHCIKRHPFTAVGFTLAVGLVVGAVIGGLRVRHRLVAVLLDD